MVVSLVPKREKESRKEREEIEKKAQEKIQMILQDQDQGPEGEHHEIGALVLPEPTAVISLLVQDHQVQKEVEEMVLDKEVPREDL